MACSNGRSYCVDCPNRILKSLCYRVCNTRHKFKEGLELPSFATNIKKQIEKEFPTQK